MEISEKENYMNPKTTEEIKKIIEEAGYKIEKTGIKGRYKIATKDGMFWKIVRFYNAKGIRPASVNILDFNTENDERWMPVAVESFLRIMEE